MYRLGVPPAQLEAMGHRLRAGVRTPATFVGAFPQVLAGVREVSMGSFDRHHSSRGGGPAHHLTDNTPGPANAVVTVVTGHPCKDDSLARSGSAVPGWGFGQFDQLTSAHAGTPAA